MGAVAIDWAGAARRHAELNELKVLLLRASLKGSWRLIAEIDRELAATPHPGWLRPTPVVTGAAS